MTLNTVYYLRQPVENIPYEFYLAFCDQQKREQELTHSLEWQTLQNELDTLELAALPQPGGANLAMLISRETRRRLLQTEFLYRTRMDQDGLYQAYTEVAIPLCLGDSYQIIDSEVYYKCVGTTPEFFKQLVLDVDTEEKFKFAEGRPFVTYSEENGFFECVVGAIVARQSGLKVGDLLNPTHGDPNDSRARVHEEGFRVVGILKGTRTPHDRAVFLNMEGFFLMEDHAKPVDDDEVSDRGTAGSLEIDPFEGFEDTEDDHGGGDPTSNNGQTADSEAVSSKELSADNLAAADELTAAELRRIPLPIEQREVTSILIRTADDEFGVYALFLPDKINEGELESTLDWSNFRPRRRKRRHRQ